MATLNEISNAFYEFSYHKYTEELKNSDKPDQKEEFPSRSVFLNDFQEKVNNVYHELDRNYPPEQAKYIYETFIANLNRQSQNPGQSRIINSSKGTINVENLKGYSKKVEETLKARHPEKFEVKEAKVENEKSAEVNRKEGDFNNPEEKKAYFQNLYIGLAECKTREDKIKWIEDGFNISLQNKSEIEQNEIISKLEMRQKIIEIRNNFHKEHQDLSDEILEDMAIEKYAKENNKDFEILKNDNNRIIELENIEAELIKLEQELSKCTDENERKELQNEHDKFKDKKEEIFDELSLTDVERKRFNEDIKKENDNSENEDLLNSFIDNEVESEEDNLSNLLTAENIELEENNLSSLFSTENAELEEDKLSDSVTASNFEYEIKNSDNLEAKAKQVINPILANSDLSQEDYTMEIEEKENLWSRIKNRFTKIKDTIMKKLNLSNSKQLKGQDYLDTAENNTPTIEDSKSSSTYTWELSQYGTSIEEVQENIENAIHNSEKNKSTDGSNIKIVSDTEINI